MHKIYLDYNASTPIAEDVQKLLSNLMIEPFGNPSSLHFASLHAKEFISSARGQIAAILGAKPSEIIFTSGGSEANNMALKGVFFAHQLKKSKTTCHMITSAVEHPAIMNPCHFLEKLGATITKIPVDKTGLVDPDDIKRAITKDTILISIMHANNEVGTIEPLHDISLIAKEHGILFHTDAAQSVGKIPTLVDNLGVDLLSIAGHKLYAPKGIGALYVRSGVILEPLIHGALHESGQRAGTESVLLDAALGKACEISSRWIQNNSLKNLTDDFLSDLVNELGPRVILNGHPTKRLPNTLNVSFAGYLGHDLLQKLEGVAASTGSACHSGDIKLSPVLSAMNIDPAIGRGAIRFSLGRGTSRDDIKYVVALLKKIVK